MGVGCILTLTGAGIPIEVVARGACAPKAAKRVATVAPLAQPRQLLALVNVCRGVREPCLEAKPKQRPLGTPMPCPGLSGGPKESRPAFSRIPESRWLSGGLRPGLILEVSL